MVARPLHIQSKPGIKRDGTVFEGDFYVDGQWVRFQRGLPRKMWGYRHVTNGFSGLSRGMYTYPLNGLLYTTSGSSGLLQSMTIDSSGIGSAVFDRTPSALVASPNNMWSLDAIFDTATAGTALIAHAATNLNDIASAANFQIYGGDISVNTALAPLGGSSPSVSGGIMALAPYLVAYGNNGFVAWSAPGDPTNWTTGSGGGAAYVTAQKIVAGIVTRGGSTNSPSALLFSLDSVIRMSFIGSTGAGVNPTFSFDTLSDMSSILSSQSVIEYDGIYYWVGLDRFLSYNGVVREVPNNLNLNFFFDNLNYAQRQKVFATKVPRFGEIWWCYPSGDSTECDRAVIYNVREQTWYDTILPNGGRSNGQFARVFQYPLMMGVTTDKAVSTLGTLVGGSTYTNGTYYNVATINTSSINGSGATFNVTVSGNAVTSVTLVSGGTGYSVGDVLTVSSALIGGTGTGFTINVASLTGYSLWQHEYGVDELNGSTVNPIESYFETGDISVAAAEQSLNKSLRITLIEPDFVQSGPMTVSIAGRANARAAEITSEEMMYPDVQSITSPPEQVVFFKTIRREMRFKFRSNVVGGDYQMGLCLAHVENADGTLLGAVASS
jgi:hypothetical protein